MQDARSHLSEMNLGQEFAPRSPFLKTLLYRKASLAQKHAPTLYQIKKS